MDAIEFWKYFNCISSIKAEETLAAFTISSYPHMKKNRRTETLNSVKRLAGKAIEVQKKGLASFADTMSKIRSILGGQ